MKEIEKIKVVAEKMSAVVFAGKKNDIVVTSKPQVFSFIKAVTAMSNGKFVLTDEVVAEAGYYNVSDLRTTLSGLKEAFVDMTGADLEGAQVMEYENFPYDVLNMSDEELYFYAQLGYALDWMDRVINSETSTRDAYRMRNGLVEKAPLADTDKVVNTLSLAPLNAYEKVVSSLISAKSNLQVEDLDIIRNYIAMNSVEMVNWVVPTHVYQRTTNAVVAQAMFERGFDISGLVKNATDAKRLALTMSEVNFARNDRLWNGRDFKLTNPQRLMVLSLINSDKFAKINLWADKESFKRLGECIHSSKYANRFPVAAEAFSSIRNDKKGPANIQRSFETLFANGEIVNAAQAIAEKPGKFAQSIDQLLSACMIIDDMNVIVDLLEEKSSLIPTKLLYQLYYHFKNRVSGQMPAFAIDSTRKVRSYERMVVELPEEIVSRVVQIAHDAWVKLLPEREYTKVFFNKEAFKGRLVDDIGSRIPLAKDARCIRFFTFWKGNDLDLSAAFLDDEFNVIGFVDYTNLRGGCELDPKATYSVYHSPDVTYAPNGGFECVDLLLTPEMREKCPARYIAVSTTIYTGHRSLREVKNAYSGFMLRDEPNSGKVFEPATVSMKERITGLNGQVVLSHIYDVQTNEILTVNVDITPEGQKYGNNILSCTTEVQAAVNAVVNIEKPNFGDILEDVFTSSGIELVEDRNDAEIIFDIDGDITPMSDVLMSEYI